MHVITIDFETYYDRLYSLSKQTTESYIRDPRFEVILVGVKLDDQDTQWFSGTPQEIKEWFDQFPWETSIVVAHNAMFDCAILNWIFNIRPYRIFDTLAAARALDGPDSGNSLARLAERYGLGQKGTEVIAALGKQRKDFSGPELSRYGSYCVNDVDLTYELFKIFVGKLPLTELQLIDLTIRMFTEPVFELDTQLLQEHLVEVRAAKSAFLKDSGISKEDLMSNPKFATILRGLGIDPPTKISPTTGKETWAFAKGDEEFRALGEHPDERVQAAYAARIANKSTLEETRTETFLAISQRGPFPIPLKYYGAHTSRWSGEDYNLQNLPRENTSKLKRSICAPEGYLILDADASQIEARLQAWVSGEDNLVEFFRKNDAEEAAGVPKAERRYDPYKIVASEIFGVSVNQIAPHQRQIGKVALLSAQYGCGWAKLLATAKKDGVVMDEELARKVIDTYRSTFKQIPKFWRKGNNILQKLEDREACYFGRNDILLADNFKIYTPTGLSLSYPNLAYEYNQKRGQYEHCFDARKGKAVFRKSIWGGGLSENIAQHLARLIIGEQMIKIAKKYRPALTVHDSIVMCVPEREAEEARDFVEKCMRTAPRWAQGLPLNCESKIGKTYG